MNGVEWGGLLGYSGSLHYAPTFGVHGVLERPPCKTCYRIHQSRIAQCRSPPLRVVLPNTVPTKGLRPTDYKTNRCGPKDTHTVAIPDHRHRNGNHHQIRSTLCFSRNIFQPQDYRHKCTDQLLHRTCPHHSPRLPSSQVQNMVRGNHKHWCFHYKYQNLNRLGPKWKY